MIEKTNEIIIRLKLIPLQTTFREKGKKMEDKRENPLKNSGSQYLIQNTPLYLTRDVSL